MKHLEDSIQKTCVQWFRLQYPKKIIFHIPNGGNRNIREAARLKAQGVLAGIPDLLIAEPNGNHSGLWIEMKSPKGRTTKSQDEMMPKLIDRGYRVSICRSLGEFQEVVKYYLRQG